MGDTPGINKLPIALAAADAVALVAFFAYVKGELSDIKSRLEVLEKDVVVVAKQQNTTTNRHAQAINSINESVGGLSSEVRKMIRGQHQQVSQTRVSSQPARQPPQRRVTFEEEESSEDFMDDEFEEPERPVIRAQPKRQKQPITFSSSPDNTAAAADEGLSLSERAALARKNAGWSE